MIFFYPILQYYYEPRTGRQFRSLVSVQKYLTESTSCTTDFRSRMTEGMISENENKVSCNVMFVSYASVPLQSIAFGIQWNHS